MAIKLIKEAIVGDYHFISSTDYLVITKAGEELVHLSVQDAHDIVEWLVTEGLFTDPRAVGLVIPTDNPKTVTKRDIAEAIKKASKKVVEPVYEPGPRTATQTVPMKLGDPNLAYRHTGGRTSVNGDGDAATTDLGALAASVAKP